MKARVEQLRKELSAADAQLAQLARDLDVSAPVPTGAMQRRPGAPTGGASRLSPEQQLQQLESSIQQESRVFQSISNIIKSWHDTAKSMINNMKA